MIFLFIRQRLFVAKQFIKMDHLSSLMLCFVFFYLSLFYTIKFDTSFLMTVTLEKAPICFRTQVVFRWLNSLIKRGRPVTPERSTETHTHTLTAIRERIPRCWLAKKKKLIIINPFLSHCPTVTVVAFLFCYFYKALRHPI